MDKKMFAVLGILAVVMLGCAYAADLAGSNTVTISGLNFTLPEGFTENVTDAIVNESNSDGDYNYVTNQKTFETEDDVIVIGVSEYGQNLTDNYTEGFGDKTTIGNVTGYLQDMDFLALFTYVQDDNKLVVISANQKSLVEDVLS